MPLGAYALPNNFHCTGVLAWTVPNKEKHLAKAGNYMVISYI